MGSCCSCLNKSKKNQEAKPQAQANPVQRVPQNEENFPEILQEEISDCPSSNFPEFFSTSAQSGVWFYTQSENNIQFPEDLQQKIESDYIQGKVLSEIILEGIECAVVFKEEIMTIGENICTVGRTKLRTEVYGWKADDGSIRPILGDVEEMLAETQGKLYCKIDGVKYNIDLPKRYILEVANNVKRGIELL